MALALQTLTMVPYLSKLIAGTDSGYPDEIHIGTAANVVWLLEMLLQSYHDR